MWSELYGRNEFQQYVSFGEFKRCSVCIFYEDDYFINSIWFLFRNNPRNPCPCTLDQAQRDRRFYRLWSETLYEYYQGVACYGPSTTSWIFFRGSWKMLRSQVNRNISQLNKTEITPFFRHAVITFTMEVWLPMAFSLVQYFPIHTCFFNGIHGKEEYHFGELNHFPFE